MFLLDDLLLAPIKGLKFIAEQVNGMVEEELYDEKVIKRHLLSLQLELDEGKVSQEEFREREEELFARLRAIKERQLEQIQQVHTANSSALVDCHLAGGDEEEK